MLFSRSIIVFFAMILLYSRPTYAQENSSALRNQIYLELGGAGPYGSLNYEYAIFKREKIAFTGRIGIASMKLIDYRRKFNPDIIVPLTTSFIYGKRHCIEVLAGNSFANKVYAANFYETQRTTTMNGTFGVFYRFRFDNIPVRIRLGYNPFLENWKQYRHWYALSFGYSF